VPEAWSEMVIDPVYFVQLCRASASVWELMVNGPEHCAVQVSQSVYRVISGNTALACRDM
jgi:hypothetical protein